MRKLLIPLLAALAFPIAVNAESDIEYMKRCAQEVRLMRMNWYFEETGMTTTSYSSAPQDLQNYYDTYDIEPNTGRELPYKDCSPSARYQ